MYLEENLKIIKERNRDIYQILSSLRPEKRGIEVFSSKIDSLPVLKIKRNQREVTFASIYSPIKEAEKMVEGVNLKDTEIIWVLGFGLGYHIRELLKRVESYQSIYIIETNLDIFKISLELLDLSEILKNKQVNIILGRNLEEIYSQIHDIDLLSKKMILFKHRASLSLETQIYNCLEKLLQNSLIYYKQKNLISLNFDDLIRLFMETILIRNWPHNTKYSFLLTSPLKDFNKILIIQLSSIGDIMYTTPVFKGLKEEKPDLRIYFLCEERNLDLVKYNPYINKVYTFPKIEILKSILNENNSLNGFRKKILEFIEPLKEEDFDLVINLHTSPLSAYINRLIEGKNSWGVNIDSYGNPEIRGPSWIHYKYWISVNPENTHMKILKPWEEHLRMCNLFPKKISLEIFTPKEIREESKRIMEDYRIEKEDYLVGFIIGSNFSSRRWKEEYFGELGNTLIDEYGYRIIIFGGGADKDRGENINKILRRRALNLTGKTKILELAALLERCDLIITGDTGPLHIASAINRECIVITGPSWVGPCAPNNLIIVPLISCAGCSKSSCNNKICMEIITPKIVLEVMKIRDYLKLKEMEEVEKLVSTLQNEKIKILFTGEEEFQKMTNFIPLKKIEVEEREIAKRILNLIYLNFWEIINDFKNKDKEFIISEDIWKNLTRLYTIGNIKGCKYILREYIEELNKIRRKENIKDSFLYPYFEFLEIVETSESDFDKKEIKDSACERMVYDLEEIIKIIDK